MAWDCQYVIRNAYTDSRVLFCLALYISLSSYSEKKGGESRWDTDTEVITLVGIAAVGTMDIMVTMAGSPVGIAAVGIMAAMVGIGDRIAAAGTAATTAVVVAAAGIAA